MELGAAEACAPYLQKHVHPATCAETIIFSCFKQDQALDRLEFPNLAARLRQNTVQKSYRPSGSIICFRVTRFRPFRPLSFRCRRRALARRSAGLKAGRYCGIAPKILPALVDGRFLRAFLENEQSSCRLMGGEDPNPEADTEADLTIMICSNEATLLKLASSLSSADLRIGKRHRGPVRNWSYAN